MFRTQHAKHYQVKYRKDTLVPRSEGRIARWIDRILDREFVPKKLYDTLRDHTPVQIFPATSTTPNGKPCANTRS